MKLSAQNKTVVKKYLVACYAAGWSIGTALKSKKKVHLLPVAVTCYAVGYYGAKAYQGIKAQKAAELK
jgi:hypothetical protein